MDPLQPGPDAITVARARPDDAASIAAIHVAVWRNAYPGILPDHTLAGLSRTRLAAHYEAAIGNRAHVLVARAEAAGIVGFSTASRRHGGVPADGEVETLYVLDDWRERGIGRTLLGQAARCLVEASCRSLFLWVLADNPSRWFYERLGGRPGLVSSTRVGGRQLGQVAMIWDRIETLAAVE